jgi:hypothetical protein
MNAQRIPRERCEAANEPQALRAFSVRICAPGQVLTFEAMSEDSCACVMQHMGLAEQIGGALSVRAVQ